MKQVYCLIFFMLIALNSSGTDQVPEVCVYKGKTLPIFNEWPLDSYLSQKKLKTKSLFGSSGCYFSACWRNYVGTWAIEDGKLYLLNIRNACYPTSLNGVSASTKFAADNLGREYADLYRWFANYCQDGKVFAYWYSGGFSILEGEPLYDSNNREIQPYTNELELQFKNGKLISEKSYDYSSSRQVEYGSKELDNYIYSNIEWDKIPMKANEKVLVWFSCNGIGQIDSTRVIRTKHDKKRPYLYDQEAIRVLKTITQGDIRLQHGQYPYRSCGVLISFTKKIRKKFDKTLCP